MLFHSSYTALLTPFKDNQIDIDVILANKDPVRNDTRKDYIEIKKLMEYKL